MRETTRERPGRGSSIGMVVAAGLIGGVIGAVIEHWAEGDRATDASASTAPNDGLVQEIRALVAELHAARLTPVESAPREVAPTSPTQAAPTAMTVDASASMAALAKSVDALAQRLATMPTAGLVLPPTDPEQRKRVEALIDPAQSKALGATLLWPAQKLVDTYGLPSFISCSEKGEEWHYQVGATGQGSVTFVLNDGHVVSMWVPH